VYRIGIFPDGNKFLAVVTEGGQTASQDAQVGVRHNKERAFDIFKHNGRVLFKMANLYSLLSISATKTLGSKRRYVLPGNYVGTEV
jgi:hypothetical protein